MSFICTQFILIGTIKYKRSQVNLFWSLAQNLFNLMKLKMCNFITRMSFSCIEKSKLGRQSETPSGRSHFHNWEIVWLLPKYLLAAETQNFWRKGQFLAENIKTPLHLKKKNTKNNAVTKERVLLGQFYERVNGLCGVWEAWLGKTNGWTRQF